MIIILAKTQNKYFSNSLFPDQLNEKMREKENNFTNKNEGKGGKWKDAVLKPAQMWSSAAWRCKVNRG